MKTVIAPSAAWSIYVAGDIQAARAVCRAFCMRGLCVTVEPTEFIYTGGAETGVRVGLINYPRFPATSAAIEAIAITLAEALIEGLCQHSASVVGPTTTTWLTRRPEDAQR